MKEEVEDEQPRNDEPPTQAEQGSGCDGCLAVVGAVLLGVFLFVTYSISMLFSPATPDAMRYLLSAVIAFVFMVILVVANMVAPGDFVDKIVRILIMAFMIIGLLGPVFIRARDNALKHRKALQTQSLKRAE